MIHPIPNQPIDFAPAPFLGHLCDEEGRPSLIGPNDMLVFMALLSPCEGAVVLPEFGFWDFNVQGAMSLDNGCLVRDPARLDGAATLSEWTPTVGTMYMVSLPGAVVQGRPLISLGGVTVEATGPGPWTITAETTAPLRIIADGDSAFTLCSIMVSGVSSDFTIEVDGAAYTSQSYPEWFTVEGRYLRFMAPMSSFGLDEGDCFEVTLTDNCDDVSMVSQVLKVQGGADTIPIRVCNSYPGLGFTVPFAPRIRVRGAFGWPAWQHEGTTEERGADGCIVRNFADRQMSMELRTDALNYHDHAFLSTLALWDHVYIGDGPNDGEWMADADGHAPRYDTQDTVAPAVIRFRPKCELVRKINEGPELPGCAPQDDPICYRSNVLLYFDGGDLKATLLDLNGFVPGDVTVTIGDASPYVTQFNTLSLPDTLTLGAVAPGEPYEVRIANAEIVGCFDIRTDVDAGACPEADIELHIVGGDIAITLHSITGGFVPTNTTISINGMVQPVTFDLDNLPDTHTFAPYGGQLVMAKSIALGVADCFWDAFLDPPFVCSGDGYASFEVLADGLTLATSSDTGYTALRDQLGNVTVHADYMMPPLNIGTYCIWACDAGGEKTGDVLELYVMGDYTTSNVGAMDYAGLSGLGLLYVGGIPHLPELPPAPDSVTLLTYDDLPLVEDVPALPATLEQLTLLDLPLVEDVPALPSGIQDVNIDNTPLLDFVGLFDFLPSGAVVLTIDQTGGSAVLGDFNPAASWDIHIEADTITFGVLPKVWEFYAAGWTNADSTAVDNLINALDPASSVKHCTTFGKVALRTSASDTAYNARIGEGWTIT